MQSHLLNFTTQLHLQVQRGGNKAREEEKEKEEDSAGETGQVYRLCPSASLIRGESARRWRGRGISACDMSWR